MGSVGNSLYGVAGCTRISFGNCLSSYYKVGVPSI